MSGQFRDVLVMEHSVMEHHAVMEHHHHHVQHPKCVVDSFLHTTALLRERFIEKEKKKKLTNVSFALTPTYVQ